MKYSSLFLLGLLTAVDFPADQPGNTIVGTSTAPGSAVASSPAGTLPPETARPEVSRPDLNSTLLLPPKRFRPSATKLNSSPGNFSYVDDNGVMLTGGLESAAAFKGMRQFWAQEKATLETKMGAKVEREIVKIIGGWSVVTYSVRVGGKAAQKNLRACRVIGDTWADVHLTSPDPEAPWNDLENTLKSLSLVTK